MDDHDQSKRELAADRTLGILVLLTVPLSWGTYVPVVRYLYEIQPPVPGFVFSAAYYVVASVSLVGLVWAQQLASSRDTATETTKLQDTQKSSSLPFLGGIELGMYLFVANGLQVVGLKTVPSDRAGFLIQLTTVMVPLVQAAFAGNILEIPIPTWIACLLAFAGVVVMGIDVNTMPLDESVVSSSLSAVVNSFSQGDLLIVMAAFMYTLHVVRLGRYAKDITPLRLAACKATTEAFLSVILVVGLVIMGDSGESTHSGLMAYAQDAGHEIQIFFASITQALASGSLPTSVLLPAVGAVLWTGWVTCAYTIYAQSFGQSRVSPTDANLIYTVQPVFTALFAWILLGETLGPAGFAGGALIALAVYLAAAMESNNESDETGPRDAQKVVSLADGETPVPR